MLPARGAGGAAASEAGTDWLSARTGLCPCVAISNPVIELAASRGPGPLLSVRPKLGLPPQAATRLSRAFLAISTGCKDVCSHTERD